MDPLSAFNTMVAVVVGTSLVALLTTDRAGFIKSRQEFADEGKKWTEILFLKLSALWVFWFGLIVVTGAYEAFAEYEYMAVGLGMAIPYFAVPLLCRTQGGDEKLPFTARNWVKANIWIAIISYVGNYFWTHYFYKLLGASYTFKSWRLNDVPIALYFCTHAYFCFYHTMTTIGLRRFWTGDLYLKRPTWARCVLSSAVVLAMAVFTAFMETWTISSFPYYVIQDRTYMYTIGSVCYGIYFIVSFPMYYRLDEITSERPSWTPARAAIDSLGACCLVTILLDLWRLVMGGVQDGVGSVIPPV